MHPTAPLAASVARYTVNPNPNPNPLPTAVQVQLPSQPPASMFTTEEDGPGWALVITFQITEDTCKQLKDLSTASPAVKLFAKWCEKGPVDPAWRALQGCV